MTAEPQLKIGLEIDGVPAASGSIPESYLSNLVDPGYKAIWVDIRLDAIRGGTFTSKSAVRVRIGDVNAAS
jgi:hypothetical protein